MPDDRESRLGVGVWGHLGSDKLLLEARRLPVGNHRRLGEDLLEAGVSLNHSDDAGDGGEGGVYLNNNS